MLGTYILYLFRIDQLDKTRMEVAPNAGISQIPQDKLKGLKQKNFVGNDDIPLDKILNLNKCVKPSNDNPFMNPLLFDSRLRDSACDAIKPENQIKIEQEYNRYCIKDISDIWNHNSGRRQFYTVASTTYPNDQGAYANWLYRRGPSCKEGNGSQCVANYYTPLNSSLITPGYGSTP